MPAAGSAGNVFKAIKKVCAVSDDFIVFFFFFLHVLSNNGHNSNTAATGHNKVPEQHLKNAALH